MRDQQLVDRTGCAIAMLNAMLRKPLAEQAELRFSCYSRRITKNKISALCGSAVATFQEYECQDSGPCSRFSRYKSILHVNRPLCKLRNIVLDLRIQMLFL